MEKVKAKVTDEDTSNNLVEVIKGYMHTKSNVCTKLPKLRTNLNAKVNLSYYMTLNGKINMYL